MSIYEAAGGAPAMLALAADFHARCLAHPMLEHPFSHGIDPHHVQHLAEYWGEVFGGPPTYSTSHGGHRAMIGVHANQGADADFGDAFVACFVEALDGAHLPPDPRLREAMAAYMRWATDEVIHYSPADAKVPAQLPMPHWDLTGLRADSQHPA